jgi:hypothetical protein
MSGHLSAEDFSAAAGGTLSEEGRAHLERCAACHAAVFELSALVAELKSDAPPEPSSLFWDHFSHRVREATRSETAPVQRSWAFGWPRVSVGAFAALTLAVLVWSSSRDRTADSPPSMATPGGSTVDSEVAWQAMSEIAAAMTIEDVQRATAAAVERSGVLTELSADERRAFVELLKREIGEVQ